MTEELLCEIEQNRQERKMLKRILDFVSTDIVRIQFHKSNGNESENVILANERKIILDSVIKGLNQKIVELDKEFLKL